MLVDLISALLFGFGLLSSTPQPIRILRAKTAEGVSLSSQVMGLTGSVAWFEYGLSKGQAIQIVNNTVSAVAIVVVLAAMSKYGANIGKLRLAALCVGTATAVTIVMAVAGPYGVAICAWALVTVQLLPQAWLAWRMPGGQGLSVHGIALFIVCGSLWALYGLLLHDTTVIANSLWALVLDWFIIVRTVQGRRLHNAHVAAGRPTIVVSGQAA